MEADNRGLLLPPQKKNFFFLIIPSSLHLLTVRPPGAGEVSSDSGKEQVVPEGQREKVSSGHQKTKGESKFRSPEPYISVKDDVGGWKESSREGVKKKEWEADTGVNPLSGSS